MKIDQETLDTFVEMYKAIKERLKTVAAACDTAAGIAVGRSARYDADFSTVDSDNGSWYINRTYCDRYGHESVSPIALKAEHLVDDSPALLAHLTSLAAERVERESRAAAERAGQAAEVERKEREELARLTLKYGPARLECPDCEGAGNAVLRVDEIFSGFADECTACRGTGMVQQ